jgi:YVTN family beta-propeller protein
MVANEGLVSVPTDLPVGTELVGYRIDGVLGRGGMGIVYLAEDLRLKRKVALKLLSPELAEDERFRERLIAESELAASLDHPNIVPIYSAGDAAGGMFISMRYVEGEDLKRLLSKGPLAPEQALALVAQVAGALDAAHARGLVHGDVKPSNVLVTPEAGHEGADHVYLADFGLTRRLAEHAVPDGSGQLLGTVDYVAPELIEGREVDGRADLYSLGCVLYECLAGEPPFPHGSDAAVLFAHLDSEPPTLPGLERVLATALAKSPDDRYRSGRELVVAAREALGLARPRRVRRRVAIGVVALLAVGAAVLAFVLVGGGGTISPSTTGRLIQIDPKRMAVRGTVQLGASPTGVAVGVGRVWMTTYRDASTWSVDPRSLAGVRIAANGGPIGVVVDHGAVYVGDTVGATRIDPASGAVSGSIAASGGAQAIADGPGGLWVVSGAPPTLERLTGNTQFGSRLVAEGPGPLGSPFDEEHALFNVTGLAVGEGAVWLLGDVGAPRLWRASPATGRIVHTVRLPFPPGGVAAGFGAVWVTAQLGDRVLRIDPRTNRIVSEISVGREPTGVAVGDGSLWVANTLDRSVSRIDPRTDRVVATVSVNASPLKLAVGRRSVWVAADAR